MYHLIQGLGKEYLTQDDSTAEMAEAEGFDVFKNLEVTQINPLLEYHATWQETPVK